jgi:hypothetical protein
MQLEILEPVPTNTDVSSYCIRIIIIILFNRYLTFKDPSYVDYMAFSDEVESIFTTKHLEKTPTAQVVQFKPNSEVDCNSLSPEEEQILQKTLHRLAERVRPC